MKRCIYYTFFHGDNFKYESIKKGEDMRHVETNKRGILERIPMKVFCICSAIILITLISFLVQTIQNNKKTPNFFGYKFYVVLSGSMNPKIGIGDIVIVKQSEKTRTGEIVAYRSGSTIIIHRVTGVSYEGGEVKYTTKGDNNNTNDIQPITNNQIEGNYVGKIRFLGYSLIYFARYWMYLLFGILLVILVKALIRNIRK